MKKFILFVFLFLVSFPAFAGMSNGSFQITHSAVLSGGGVGQSASASSAYVLKAFSIGEPAYGTFSNTSYRLRGSMRMQVEPEPETELMRVNVSGTINDPTAMIYVNEVCAINKGAEWIAPFVTVKEGANQLLAHAYDALGNAREFTITVYVDTTAPAKPTAAFSSPTASVNPTITGTKEVGAELWVRLGAAETHIPGFLDALSWTYAPLLKEGTNHLEFFLVDPAGNKSTAFPADIILDTDQNMFTVISPRDGMVTQSATVDVVGRLYDHTATVTVAGAAAEYLGDGSLFRKRNVLLPQVGANAITIHAESVTGFIQDKTISIVRDPNAILPPTLNALPPFLGSTAVTFSGNCDVGDLVIIRLNVGAAVTPCPDGSFSRPAALSLGQNLITLEARSSATNTNVPGDSAEVFVDITPPSVPFVSDGGGVQSSTTAISVNAFSYDGETSVTDFEYAFGTSQAPPIGLTFQSAGSSGMFNVAGSFSLDTTYYVYVRAKNAAGLTSAVGVSDGITISNNQLPMILMLTPPVGEFRYPGEKIDWRLVVHDPDDDVLQFKYALNGITAFTFSENPERTYTVSSHLFGRQHVLGVVRDDPQNAFQEWPSAETSFFVVRKPVEP